jgi:hypothetical protein
VLKEEEERLRQRLVDWRNEKHRQRGSPIFHSAQIILPPKQLDSFVAQSNRFLQEQILTPRLLRKLVSWDSATDCDLEQIVSIITDWREMASITIPTTPTSQRRARKKGRSGQEDNHASTPKAPPIAQPTFTSHFRLARPGVRPAGDENIFQTPHPPPRSTLHHTHQMPQPSPMTYSTPQPTMTQPYQHANIPPSSTPHSRAQAPLTPSTPYNPYLQKASTHAEPFSMIYSTVTPFP